MIVLYQKTIFYIMNQFFDKININDNTLFVPDIGVGSSYIGKKKEDLENRYLTRYENTDIPDSWKNFIKEDAEITHLCEKLTL